MINQTKLLEESAKNKGIISVTPSSSTTKNLQLFITYNCFFKCNYCTIYKNDNQFLDLKHLEYAIEHFKGYRFNFIGGEPLLHPKIKEFTDLACQTQPEVQIDTNGFLLNKIKLNPEITVSASIHFDYLESKNINPLSYINKIKNNNYKNIGLNLICSYNFLKKHYNLIIHLAKIYNLEIIFQDCKKVINEFPEIANLQNRDIEVKFKQNSIKIYTDSEMRHLGFTNFKNYYCTSGVDCAMMDANGNIYRCTSQFIAHRNLNKHQNKQINFNCDSKCDVGICFDYSTGIKIYDKIDKSGLQ